MAVRQTRAFHAILSRTVLQNELVRMRSNTKKVHVKK
jgi:hypothetical protein